MCLCVYTHYIDAFAYVSLKLYICTYYSYTDMYIYLLCTSLMATVAAAAAAAARCT